MDEGVNIVPVRRLIPALGAVERGGVVGNGALRVDRPLRHLFLGGEAGNGIQIHHGVQPVFVQVARIIVIRGGVVLRRLAAPVDVVMPDVAGRNAAVLPPEIARAVVLVRQLADVVHHFVVGGCFAFVAAAVHHQRGMVADALGVQDHRLVQHVLGLDLLAVPAARPFLVYADAVLVAQVVVVVGLAHAAAPGAERVEALVFGAAEDAVVVFAGEVHRGVDRAPVGAPQEQRFAVDPGGAVVHAGLLFAAGGDHLQRPYAEAGDVAGPGAGVADERGLQRVQVLLAEAVGPPELELGQVEAQAHVAVALLRRRGQLILERIGAALKILRFYRAVQRAVNKGLSPVQIDQIDAQIQRTGLI